jgi:hypothetical protein
MLKWPLIFFICIFPALASAQKLIDRSRLIDTSGKRDIGDIAKRTFDLSKASPRPASNNQFYFSVLPVPANGFGNSKAFFTATTLGFYLGNHNTTYLSNITFAPYFNFTGRYGLPFRSSIWLADNSWNIQGDMRLMVYPQNTWGLGGREENNKLLINYKYVRFYQSALKRITPYFYAGVGYDLDYFLDMETTTPGALPKFTSYKIGTSSDQNTVSAGPTFNLLYDTRNNDINPLPGSYINLVYRFNNKAFGSNTNWQSVYVDYRKYIKLTHSNQQNVLAFWTYYWTTLTGSVPYLNLPSIGWEPYQRSGRGIQQNKYRGGSLLYFEGEYRRDITADGLLGFVVFANINSVAMPHTTRFSYWHPAGGTGLRIKINKSSGTNVNINYGFSKGYSTVMLGLGEAF